jgi:thioredoxin reductase (NADPH)
MDRRIGVFGTAKEAGRKALFLRTYSRDIVMFETAGGRGALQMQRMLSDAGVEQAGKPIAVEYADNAIAVTVERGRRFVVDVLYPAFGCEVRSELAVGLGAGCTDVGTLKVDEHQQTTVDCLYAAGDVVSDLHQLTVATGHAAIAATSIHNRLRRNPR